MPSASIPSGHSQDSPTRLRQKYGFRPIVPAVSGVFPCTCIRCAGEGVFQVQRLSPFSGMLSLGMLAIGLTPNFVLAQEPGPDPGLQPCSGVTGQATGCQLIAWSQIQQPQPLRPAPSPSPDQQTERASGQRRPLPADPKSGVQPPLIGVVAQDSGNYVLKTEDSATCQLDDQGRSISKASISSNAGRIRRRPK